MYQLSIFIDYWKTTKSTIGNMKVWMIVTVSKQVSRESYCVFQIFPQDQNVCGWNGGADRALGFFQYKLSSSLDSGQCSWPTRFEGWQGFNFKLSRFLSWEEWAVINNVVQMLFGRCQIPTFPFFHDIFLLRAVLMKLYIKGSLGWKPRPTRRGLHDLPSAASSQHWKDYRMIM